MKKNLVKLAAVAAVVIMAPVAGAQQFLGRLQAEVPFAFQAGKASLVPGGYEMTMSLAISGNTIVRMQNRESGKAIHFIVPMPYVRERAETKPFMRFSCLGGACLLQSVSVHNKEYGTGMKHKMTSAERERLYTIDLTPHKGRSAE